MQSNNIKEFTLLRELDTSIHGSVDSLGLIVIVIVIPVFLYLMKATHHCTTHYAAHDYFSFPAQVKGSTVVGVVWSQFGSSEIVF